MRIRRIPLAAVSLGMVALLFSGCTPAAPVKSADRAGARVGQLTVALAGLTPGVWAPGLEIGADQCEPDDGGAGMYWHVDALQDDAIYPFAREGATVEELAANLAAYIGEYGYETDAQVVNTVGDLVQISLTGNTGEAGPEWIEFSFSFYPDDVVSAVLHIRTECLPGDEDSYPQP